MIEQPLHILLVEDNLDDADLIRKILLATPHLACGCSHVASMADAFDFFATHPVDVLLLALNPPDTHDRATMDRLRDAAASLPVIVLIAGDDGALGPEAIKAGAQDCLVKGRVTVETIERAVRSALERHRATTESRAAEQLLRATLDTLPAHIAILDPSGEIIAVNRAWNMFAAENKAEIFAVGPGANYLEVCDASAASADDGFIAAIAGGIRAVINEAVPSLHLEYPCPSPEKERWFALRVTPLPGTGKRRVVVAHENVTARKLAERARAKSEDVFEKIFETVPLGLWLADAGGALVRGNPEGIRIWGGESLVTPQEYGIFKAKRLPGGEAVLPHEWSWCRTLREGVAVHDELLEIEAFDGERRTILNSSVPLRNAAGEIEGAIVSNLDITKRLRAEEALRASEQRLRLVFDSSPNCLFIKGSDGRYVMVNKSAAKLFARTPEEMIGQTDAELGIVGFTPAQSISAPLGMGGQETAGWANAAGTEEYLHVDTSRKWFRVHRDPVAFVDAPACVLTHAVDITAQRKAREEIRNSELMTRTILDSLTSRVHLMDKELRIIWANRAACVYAGMERFQMTGVPCYEVFGEKQAGICRECPATQSLATGKGSEQVRKTDKGHTWLTYALPIRDARGEVVSIVEVADDITDRLSLEVQLRQAQKMESLGTLAGGIAHDFNNILSAILGFSELALMKAGAYPDVKEYLKEIYYAGTRATELVRQILTFSRRGMVERQPLQVSLVIREAIRLLRSTLPTTVEIKTAIEKNLAPVLADPTQIHQIIMNLCTNASHAMEPDGGMLTVTVNQVTLTPELKNAFPGLAEGSYVQLQVRDTGSGIPEENLPFIFDPYFTTKDLGEGTGLGLAVVHGIVREYGGDIRVDSVLGAGSTFTIVLPATAPQQIERRGPAEEKDLKGEEGNILVVDDESAVCRIIEGLLAKAGYSVTTATDPFEALDLFTQDPSAFDLVISDITMPKLTGDKLGQQMLALRPELPVVLMTGFNQRLTDEGITALGFRKLINKPFAKNVLLDCVTEVLEDL